MEEIKVGEYVRTKKGYISKIIDIDDYYIWFNSAIDTESGMAVFELSNMEFEELVVKHSPNIIDLIEDEDFVILEYKSPKYRERIKRIFEVSKIDEYISFENVHCGFNCKVGDKKIIDNICKNVKIKSIVTHEQFQSLEYRLEE